MIEYIIPALVVVLPSAGFVGGAIWATRGRDEYVVRLTTKLAAADQLIRRIWPELTKLREEKRNRMAPANAARKAKQISKETQARLIQQATHDGMRAKLRTAELV